MNAAVRKISQEFSKLRASSRLGSNEVDSDTSFESVYYPGNESSAKWSPFRRRTKLVEKTDEAKRLSGSYLARRHSRNENDQDIEVIERKCTVNSLRPPVSRHARSDLGTYSNLNIVSSEESNQLLVKKPRKVKLKRHKSLSGILRITQATTNEDTKKDNIQKPRRKLKRSISFSGRFGNKNKGEDTKASQQIRIQKRNKELSNRNESLLSSSSMSRSISVDAGKKSMCVAVLPSASSCGRESSSSTAADVENSTTRLTRRSSSAGNINTRYNCVNEVVPRVKLTIYRRNSFNGRLSIYDSFGHRLSMVETDLCSTEL